MPHFECGAIDHSATSPGAMAGGLAAPVGRCSRRGWRGRQGAGKANLPRISRNAVLTRRRRRARPGQRPAAPPAARCGGSYGSRRRRDRDCRRRTAERSNVASSKFHFGEASFQISRENSRRPASICFSTANDVRRQFCRLCRAGLRIRGAADRKLHGGNAHGLPHAQLADAPNISPLWVPALRSGMKNAAPRPGHGLTPSPSSPCRSSSPPCPSCRPCRRSSPSCGW